MKQKVDSAARQRTRRLILEAMADVVTETAGIGFSVQAVADRAGVTHRTVYNHFRTREALCEAFEGYVDEQLSANGVMREPTLALATLPDTVDTVYRILALRDRHVRASVMLMIGNRRPLGTWRKRTQAIEKLIAAAPARQRPVTPRQVTAAIRLFVSSMGWHLLTEQFGMTTDEAAATSAWATRALLDAATGRPLPPASPTKTKSPRTAPRRRASKGPRS